MKYSITALDLTMPETATELLPLVRQLRPHIDDEADLARRFRDQEMEAYRLFAARIDNVTVGFSGFRFITTLAWGSMLYIDDLFVDPERRGAGLGGALLDRVVQHATKLGCAEVHLDTGFTRHDAHRLYLNRGFRLDCHHMSLAINER